MANSTPVKPLDPSQPLAVFGSLTDATRQLTARLDAMLARDPAIEFGQSEGKTGSRYDLTSFSKCETFLNAPALAAPLSNVEFVTSIYPKALRVKFSGLGATAAIAALKVQSLLTAGLLVEFYKDLRGNGGGMATSRPDGQIFLPFDLVLTMSGNADSGFYRATIDRVLPLSYRYLKISLFDALSTNPIKVAGNLSTVLAVVSQLEVNYLGD